MLPLFALPLMMGATNAGLTVATDVVFGLNNAMQGRMGSFSDAFDGFFGGNNDTFIGCVSEGVVHGVMSTCKIFTSPIRSVYNGIRGVGEFASGDYIDGAIHTFTAVTGFDCVTNLAGKVAEASGSAAKSQVAKQGLKEIAKESGLASGALLKNFLKPWLTWFNQGAKSTKQIEIVSKYGDALREAAKVKPRLSLIT